MGSTGTAIRNPDLFAAIAPVAGHHDRNRAQWITSQLAKVPLFVAGLRSFLTLLALLEALELSPRQVPFTRPPFSRTPL